MSTGLSSSSMLDESTTSLHLAVQRGDLQAIRTLLADTSASCVDCDDGNEGVLMNIVESMDAMGLRPLHYAAAGDHSEVLRVLLSEMGADGGARDSYGRTAFHYAAKHGHIDTLRVLREELVHTAYEMQINSGDDKDDTPLHYAAREGKSETVLELVNHFGADVNLRNKWKDTPLRLALKHDRVETARALTSCCVADIEAPNSLGYTLLHTAAQNGSTDVVCALAESGANVNARALLDSTPLHFAVEKGHADTVRVLIKDFRADIHAKDREGDTPLHCAFELFPHNERHFKNFKRLVPQC